MRRTLKAIAIACSVCIIEGEDKDPYEISTHSEGCQETIFTDNGNLLDDDDMAEVECLCCWQEWGTIDRVIEDTGEIRFYDLALEAFKIAEWFDSFNPNPKQVSAWDWRLFEIVKSERHKREIQRQIQENQKAKNAQG